LLAALTGFVCALLFSSIPVGPINLTILNEGARRGFRWALLIGLGAATMDVIYCAIAFTGFSSFFDHGIVKASMQVFSFVFCCFSASNFCSAKP
jgi:threonine/homoserine/homoserine lactone efflux protein